MIKTIPSLNAGLLLPPVSPDRYPYFEAAAQHPFEDAPVEPALCQAWWLAECSLAAYADQAMAEGIFRRGKLAMSGGGPVLGQRYGGQCYVVSDDHKIIIVFRGTQVVKSEHVGSIDRLHDTVKKVLRDLMTDAKVKLVPWTGRSGGLVHRGFSDSLKEMLLAIRERIGALNESRPGRQLWLTGHSLGGALATLAADCLDGVTGLHTFGSPQVGNAVFAQHFKTPGSRFRNHTDAVAWVPGTVLGYQHVNNGRYFDRLGTLREEPGTAGLLLDGMAGVPASVLESLHALSHGNLMSIVPEAFNDHAPIFYALLTWNAYTAAAASRQPQPAH